MKRLMILALMIILATVVMADGIDSNTVLMLHADGDESASDHTYTAYGNPQLVTSGKFDGAVSLDGTGDYLSLSDSDDWNFGDGNFTIDFWVMPSSFSSRQILINNEGEWLVEIDADNKFHADFSFGSLWNVPLDSADSYSVDQWYHLAIVRDGTTLFMYIDGNLTDSAAISGSITPYSGICADMWSIGAGCDGSSGFNGYMDEFRISKGVARWTEDFTPDTTPYATDANTDLLLSFEGDVSTSDHDITFNGDADVSASTYKFDGSYYFDGSGDYLSIPDSTDWDFGTGDFTIDYWINPTDNSDYSAVISTFTGSADGWAMMHYHDVDAIYLQVDATYYGFVPVTYNAWQHIAFVRNGSVIKAYKNGVEVDSQPVSEAIDNDDNSRAVVGRYYHATDAYYFQGQIDELRISKGIARWTSAFTPDTVPYSAVVPVEPTYTEFSGDGDTTDFSSVDVTAVVDPVLADTNVKVEWKGTLDLDGADLDSAVDFSSNFVYVDSAALAALNTRANITLKGINYDSVNTYYILKDGVACGDCVKYSANPVKFEVTGFSNYTTGGNSTGIPEFSTMTLGIGLFAVLVGLILIRRRK